MKFSAVILAGGKSSRMGNDKAFLEVAGKSLLARQIELARETGAAEICISGRPDVDYSKFGLGVIHDDFTDTGPLAGIHAALAATKCPLLLVLAVDMPAMNATFMKNLAGISNHGTGVIPRIAGQIEPLAAIYPRSALTIAGKMLSQRQFAVQKFAHGCVASGLAEFVDFSPEVGPLFKNANHPSDLA